MASSKGGRRRGLGAGMLEKRWSTLRSGMVRGIESSVGGLKTSCYRCFGQRLDIQAG